jgi:hypothetical protein
VPPRGNTQRVPEFAGPTRSQRSLARVEALRHAGMGSGFVSWLRLGAPRNSALRDLGERSSEWDSALTRGRRTRCKLCAVAHGL